MGRSRRDDDAPPGEVVGTQSGLDRDEDLLGIREPAEALVSVRERTADRADEAGALFFTLPPQGTPTYWVAGRSPTSRAARPIGGS